MNKHFYIFLLLLNLSFICPKTVESLYVKENKLYDGKGNEFIFRGINLPHAWFKDKTEFSIGEISSLGANSARIVLACGSQYTKTTYSEVENIINWCETKGLICVLELHDFTGSDDPSDISKKSLDYWIEMKSLINEHKKYIIINIANEWQGTWNQGNLWGDTYVGTVKSMRENGIENVIMIDASGYGQETGPVIKDAKRVLEADPDKNVIFSYHVYSALGKDNDTLYAGFDGLKNTGVCWVAGEFGWFQNEGNVVYKTLMDYCQKNNIGWIAWSWAGNGGDDACLDITSAETFAKENLTQWGKDVFYSEYGIKNTALKAYSRGKYIYGVKNLIIFILLMILL